jgi:heme-degrading monooxygenase HmoA
MHILIWEYKVKADKLPEFEKVYGPGGEWTRLFERAEGYLGSDLHRDLSAPQRYIVLDRWESKEAFESFRERFRAEYGTLDRRCEPLREQETLLGIFSLVGTLRRKGRAAKG